MLLIFAYNNGGVLTLAGGGAVVATVPVPTGMLAAKHVRRQMRRGR